METLVWMGFLGVVGFMTLFWVAHKPESTEGVGIKGVLKG